MAGSCQSLCLFVLQGGKVIIFAVEELIQVHNQKRKGFLFIHEVRTTTWNVAKHQKIFFPSEHEHHQINFLATYPLNFSAAHLEASLIYMPLALYEESSFSSTGNFRCFGLPFQVRMKNNIWAPECSKTFFCLIPVLIIWGWLINCAVLRKQHG